METCPDCKRPLPVDDAHRCPEDRGDYCWRTWSRSPEEKTAHLIECLRAQIVMLAGERDDEAKSKRDFEAQSDRYYVRHQDALRERDEARDWVRQLTATERTLTCAFCGEAYPPGTPETNHERLTAHVKVCAKHPMREVEAACAVMREALSDLPGCCKSSDWHFCDMDKKARAKAALATDAGKLAAEVLRETTLLRVVEECANATQMDDSDRARYALDDALARVGVYRCDSKGDELGAIRCITCIHDKTDEERQRLTTFLAKDGVR